MAKVEKKGTNNMLKYTTIARACRNSKILKKSLVLGFLFHLLGSCYAMEDEINDCTGNPIAPGRTYLIKEPSSERYLFAAGGVKHHYIMAGKDTNDNVAKTKKNKNFYLSTINKWGGPTFFCKEFGGNGFIYGDGSGKNYVKITDGFQGFNSIFRIKNSGKNLVTLYNEEFEKFIYVSDETDNSYDNNKYVTVDSHSSKFSFIPN